MQFRIGTNLGDLVAVGVVLGHMRRDIGAAHGRPRGPRVLGLVAAQGRPAAARDGLGQFQGGIALGLPGRKSHARAGRSAVPDVQPRVAAAGALVDSRSI